MLRFLKSIGLEAESLDTLSDLDFELVGRDPYNPHLIHMTIRKENPWDFSALETFLEGLSHIPYPYDLRFSYENPCQFEDLDALFHDWYFATYHVPSAYSLEQKEESVVALCPTKEEAKASLTTVQEAFRSFVDFLSYPYQMVTGEMKAMEDVSTKGETPLEPREEEDSTEEECESEEAPSSDSSFAPSEEESDEYTKQRQEAEKCSRRIKQ